MRHTRLFAKILSGIIIMLCQPVLAQEKQAVFQSSLEVYQAFEKPFIMLVRIQERTQQRKYLERNNLTERLAKFDLKQKNLIQEITSALQIFTSKVGYFYAKDNNQVLAGDYSTVMGLDSDNFEGFQVFIVDPYSRPTAWSSEISALSIYDRYGNDLPDPFPDYVLKRTGSIFFVRTYEDMAKVLKRRMDNGATRLKF